MPAVCGGAWNTGRVDQRRGGVLGSRDGVDRGDLQHLGRVQRREDRGQVAEELSQAITTCRRILKAFLMTKIRKITALTSSAFRASAFPWFAW